MTLEFKKLNIVQSNNVYSLNDNSENEKASHRTEKHIWNDKSDKRLSSIYKGFLYTSRVRTQATKLENWENV